jgi:hypothetical protein
MRVAGMPEADVQEPNEGCRDTDRCGAGESVAYGLKTGRGGRLNRAWRDRHVYS